MTRDTWIESLDPLVVFTRIEEKKPSSRKMRLASVACCRWIWDLVTDERSRVAVNEAEMYADDRSRHAILAESESEAAAILNLELSPGQSGSNDIAAAASHCAILWASASWATLQVLRYTREGVGQSVQMHILDCIFGLPHRQRKLDPAWLTPTAVAIATAIYADRAFDRMPILADALEEAGCVNADVLLHCRGGGPHVRGCWVVDLLLGKE